MPKTAETVDMLTSTSFHESDAVLYNWLKNLATYGVSVIEETPAENTSVRHLAERVAFIRKTHYGYIQITLILMICYIRKLKIFSLHFQGGIFCPS